MQKERRLLARKKHHTVLIPKPYVLLKKTKNLRRNLSEILEVIEVKVGRIIEAGGAEIFRKIDSRMNNKEIFLINQL